MILANGCNITKSEKCKGVWILSVPTVNEINEFLSNIDLPQINEESVEMLEKEITLNEVNKVVNNLLNNKYAGPEGFSAEYYKTLWEILASIFLRVINHSLSQLKLPPTL